MDSRISVDLTRMVPNPYQNRAQMAKLGLEGALKFLTIIGGQETGKEKQSYKHYQGNFHSIYLQITRHLYCQAFSQYPKLNRGFHPGSPRNCRDLQGERMRMKKEVLNSPIFVTRHRGTFGELGVASAVDKGIVEPLTAVSSETLFLQIFALDPKQQGCRSSSLTICARGRWGE